jgi:hypothetical protein
MNSEPLIYEGGGGGEILGKTNLFYFHLYIFWHLGAALGTPASLLQLDILFSSIDLFLSLAGH